MITRNKFYRQTGAKSRSLAASQIVSKDGYRVEIPAACFTTHGLMKTGVLRHVTGPWNKEKVAYLVNQYGAVVLTDAESA